MKRRKFALAMLIAALAAPQSSLASRGGKPPAVGPLSQKQAQKTHRSFQKEVLKAKLAAAKQSVSRGKATLLQQKQMLKQLVRQDIAARREWAEAGKSHLRALSASRANPTEQNAALERTAQAQFDAASARVTAGSQALIQAQSRLELMDGHLQRALGTLTAEQQAAKRGPPKMGRPTYAAGAKIARSTPPAGYSVAPHPVFTGIYGPAPASMRRTHAYAGFDAMAASAGYRLAPPENGAGYGSGPPERTTSTAALARQLPDLPRNFQNMARTITPLGILRPDDAPALSRTTTPMGILRPDE